MGKGARRRIRMKEEEKQTSILLPWWHLGIGIMGRNEQETGQRKGRWEKYQRIAEHRSK